MVGGVSLAVVNGNPAISRLCGTPPTDLAYVRSTTSTGENVADWTQKVLIFIDAASWLATSLSVVDGNPAISFGGTTDAGYGLKYVRSTTGTGADLADWSQLVTIDESVSNVGELSVLAVLNGRPVIGYCDGTNAVLKIVRATSSNGASSDDWQPPQQVHSTTVSLGEAMVAMAIVNGNPAFSFRAPEGDLTYAYYVP